MKKILTFLLALFSFALLSQAQVTIAEWNFGDEAKRDAIVNHDDFLATPYTADDGIDANKDIAPITLNGGPQFTGWVSGITSGTTIPNSNTWTDEADTKCWLISISTEGYENLKISSKLKGSNTGPKDFQLEYSLDGNNWVSFGEPIEVANNNTTGVVANLELPVECADVEELKIRWINTSTTSINDGTVADGGTNRIGDIVITGEEIGGGTPIIPELAVLADLAAYETNTTIAYQEFRALSHSLGTDNGFKDMAGAYTAGTFAVTGEIEADFMDSDYTNYNGGVAPRADALEDGRYAIAFTTHWAAPAGAAKYARENNAENATILGHNEDIETDPNAENHWWTWTDPDGNHYYRQSYYFAIKVDDDAVWELVENTNIERSLYFFDEDDELIAIHEYTMDFSAVEILDAEPPTFTLSGKVKALTEADNGDDEGDKDGDYEYLAGVVVKLGEATTTTDENGAFSFTELDGGDYALTITHAGFKGYSQEIAVNADVELDDIILTPLSTYTVIGKVVSEGTYIEGVVVKLGTPTSTTDENGAYSFEGVVEGTYTITTSHAGYVDYSGEVILSDDLANAEGVIELADIELEAYIPKYTIKGVVYGPEGLLAGATVTLGTESMETTSTGAFSFEDILGGDYTLTVSKEFHVDYVATVDTENAVNELLNLGNIRLTYEGYPFYETFAGLPVGSLPEGWTTEGLGLTNWKIANTSNAGGAAPEMLLTWTPAFNGISSVVTPAIDPMNNSALKLSFKHYYSHYSTYVSSLKVKVSFDEGDWEDLLTFELTATFPSTGDEVSMTIPEDTDSFRLAWEFEGDSYGFNSYNFDNVIVEPILAHDLSAIAVTGNVTPTVGTETIFTVSVQNRGLTTEDDYTVRLMDSEGVELATATGVEIESDEIKEIPLTWTPGEAHEGAMSIYAEVILDSDQNLSNNQTPELIIAVQPEGVISVVIGDQTGTGTINIPFNFYYKSSIAQTLYFAEEFDGTAGAITSIAYTNSFLNNLSNKEIKVWMGVTEAENLVDGWISHEELTLVYDGIMDFPSGENSILIPLDVPFVYTGGNLVVYTNRVLDTQYHSSSDKFFITEDAGSKRTRYAQSDSGVNPEAPIAGSVSDWFSDATFFFVSEGLGSLEGTVTDGTDALEGVEVSVVGTPIKVYTDADGKYEFPSLMEDSYDISFTKIGFYDYLEEDVVIVSGAATVLDVEMAYLPLFNVTGIVTDINDDVLEGATVTLTGQETYTTLTNDAGVFVFENIFMDDYTFTIEMEGYQTWVEEGLAVNAEEVDEDGLLDLGTFTLIGMMEIIIGEGAILPGIRIPFDFYWKNSFAQTIYYADEINLGAGWIHSVVYTNNFTQTLANKEIRVWIGETDATNLSDGWIPLEDLTQVFDGTMTFPIGENNIEVMFDQPFAYNGGNLVIYTNRVFEDSYASSNDKFYATEYAGSQRTRHRQADGTAALDPEDPGAGTISNWAPNTSLLIEVDGLGTLAGIIVNADTEDPVEGALVTISSSNAQPITDEDGEFIIKLFPGTYEVTVSSFGYETQLISNVVVTADETEVLIVDLEPLTAYDVIGVVKGDDNALLAGATVTFTGDNTDLTMETEADGIFIFEEIMEGTYTISVTRDGYESYTNDAVAVNGEVAEAGIVELDDIILTEIIVAPYGLMAEVEGETNVRFSWNNAVGFTDDFESYEDFIIEDIGDYTLYDGDGSTTYAFSGVLFPNSAYVGSYIIFNPSQTTPDMTATPAIQPHSGDKFLGCFAATNGPNNDWVITPQFTAAAGMKFSFYAKTYMDYGLEQFKVAISTTDTDVESFEFITGVINAPLADWGYFEYDLSDYAGQNIYAAIVCVSNDVFVFMVDDLEVGMDMSGKTNLLGYTVPTLSHYSATQTMDTRAFTGYKVYLDGELVTETAITAEEYLFQNLTPGETYVAGVRSVYTSGESDMETLTFTLPDIPAVYTVKGLVKDSEGALANVEVKLDAQTTTTGADGTFSFTEVEEGVYTLTIDHPGYVLYEQPVNTANAVDGIVDLGDILLDPIASTYIVKGAVKDSEGALANVEVKLDTYTTTTAADGTFSFTEVEEGAYTLTIDHDGYAHHEQPVNTANAIDGIVDLGDILLDPVGIMDNTLSTLSAYPNPFHNQLNISHPELVERVIVTNSIGQRVMDITLNGKGYISTDKLTQGVYLITFQGFDGDTVVKTLMKE